MSALEFALEMKRPWKVITTETLSFSIHAVFVNARANSSDNLLLGISVSETEPVSFNPTVHAFCSRPFKV